MEINNNFVVGDTVWFNIGGRERIDGKVVKIIPKEELGYHEEHYIIEVSSQVGAFLEISTKSLTFATKEPDRLTMEQKFKELKQLFKNYPLTKNKE